MRRRHTCAYVLEPMKYISARHGCRALHLNDKGKISTNFRISTRHLRASHFLLLEMQEWKNPEPRQPQIQWLWTIGIHGQLILTQMTCQGMRSSSHIETRDYFSCHEVLSLPSTMSDCMPQQRRPYLVNNTLHPPMHYCKIHCNTL